MKKKLSETFRELMGFVSPRAPRRSGSILVMINRQEAPENPEAAQMVGLGLYDACTRRGVSSALIDVDEWMTRAVLQAGRFDPQALPDPGVVDLFTNAPAWERSIKADVSWLLRNRSGLLRAAMSGGGEVDVVIVLHELDLMEAFLHVDPDRHRKMMELLVYPAGLGREGFELGGSRRDLSAPMRFGVNAADDAKTWDVLLDSVLTPRK